jgi:hypothetical protein
MCHANVKKMGDKNVQEKHLFSDFSMKTGALLKLAPRAGFEPATCRLTVECSTAELPGNTALRRVRRVIQTLFRFAKRFFKKNPICLFNSQLIPISRPEK